MAPHWRAFLFLLLPALLALLGFHPGILLSALMVLGLSWAFLALEGRDLASLGLRLNARWGLDLLWGIGLGVGLMGLVALSLRGLGAFHWEPNLAFRGIHLGTGAASFALVAVHEECLFRGYPFQRLAEVFGAWPAQLVLALLFALIHWGNPGMVGPTRSWATLNIMLAALLLGLCYLRTRSLALPMGLHLGWNWAQGNLLGFPVSGTTFAQSPWQPVLHDSPQWLTGGPFGLEASALCTLVCLGAILSLGLWKVRPSVS
ncbi:CPBP family intramembrane glutamic endopeptidase [Holophaga foetida]|uniref:CPBP family intramembrane glutamic endopeptidase n=1 Tax=Holophaga foetida TaxID=35839 RepID=UPI00024749EC|nr:CPBP family intramembrane glutamic endopeptidase [Holophaga foetida]